MPNYNSSHTGSEIDGAVTKVNASGVTQTELSYLDGLSSNIQTQLGLKAALNDNTQNIIANNITVHGTLTTKDSQNVNIGDAIITLNAEETGTPSENAGFEIERGTSTNTVLRWNESSDRWEFTNDGSTFYNIPISTEYNNYTLPTASGSTLGGIKVGTNLSIDGNGVLSASGSFTSFTIADSDSTQAIGDGVHIKFAASNSGAYGNSEISGSGTSMSPYLITLYAPATDLNTLSAGTINTANDSIGFIDADNSNASKKESIADFLTAIAGSGISASSGQLSRDSMALNQLSNVSSVTPSTGQYLVYGGSQWEPTSVTAMTSWYLRDGDTTAVQVTNGKYVKFVEGNNLIDINFTDTDSGAVDDEFDVTFTVNSSNITSVGTLTGLTVANNNITLQGTGETQLLINAASGNNAGIRFQENSSNKWTIGNDQSNDSLFFYDFGASATRFSINSSGNATFTGTVTWSGGSSTNANTAYGWGDHASAGYLENLTGTSIKTLLDVASNSPSNGQILQWNSTANYYEPVTLTSSYSWYLRDGDTTAVEITDGKYVKLVEGTGIDINFTDTSSGAVDDEYDITITNTLMTSGGTIGGNVTVSPGAIGINMNPASSPSVLDIGGNTAVSRIWNGSSTFVGGVGTDSWAHSGNTTDLTVYAQAQLHISANGSKRMLINSSYVMSYMDLYVNKSSPYVQFGNGGNTTSAAIRLGGDNAAGGRLYFQYNGDSSYIDCYGGHGSTERYRDLTMSARSFTFRTGASTSLGTALTINSSQNATFVGTLAIGNGNHTFTSLSSTHLELKGGHSAAVGIKLSAGGNLRGWVYANDSYAQGFLTTAGQWALRKDNDGQLILRISGAEQTVHHTSNLGAWADSNRNFRFGSPTNTSGQGLMGQRNDGTFQWQLYGDGSSVGFLDGAFASWDLKKDLNGHLLVYGSGSNVAKLGSGDEWGRLEFDNFSNGTYFYLNQGTFRIDGDWNPYGNSVRDLGSDSLRWDNIWINTIAQVGQLKLNNNFKWEQGSSDYGRFSSWLQGGGSHGIYFPSTGMTSSPHFYPVGSSWSYGTFLVSNGMSSWHGMALSGHSSKPTYMHDSSHGGGGLYYQATPRWAMYWDVGNDCLAVGASTNSSSYWLYVHGAIYSTGDVVAFSDARVKTNVLTIDNALDKVLNMRGVYYNPINKETKEVDDRRRVGVIAQELNKVLPEAVTYAEDVDEYGVDYGKLTGVLIEAIKELKQEINELKGN